MWTEPVVTVAAAAEPVSLAEAKAHCRVTSSDHDTVLALYIAAARDFAERYTGARFAEQTVTFSAPYFSSVSRIPVAPVQSLTVAYLDADNTSQALSADVYDFSGADTLRPALTLADGKSWPTTYNAPEAVTVTAVTGYSETPAALKAAILLHVGHLFDNRETVSTDGAAQVPLTTMDLLENYRTF